MVQPTSVKRGLNPANSQHEPVAVELREGLPRQHCRCCARNDQRLETDSPQNIRRRKRSPLGFAGVSRISRSWRKQVSEFQSYRANHFMRRAASEAVNQDSAWIDFTK